MKHKETNRPPAFGSTDSDDLATPAIKQAVAALLADRHAAKRPVKKTADYGRVEDSTSRPRTSRGGVS